VQMGETAAFWPGYRCRLHQNSIRLVCRGNSRRLAIDSQVLAIELRDRPELAAQVRVIDTLALPRFSRSSLPADAGAFEGRVQAVLLAMATTGGSQPPGPRLCGAFRSGHGCGL